MYLRPWTLVQEHASPHVPHLLDLDVVVTSAFVPLRRHRVKKPRNVVLQRSMVDAWKDYSRHHIVSKHALQLIRNFTLAQVPETVEADKEDEEETKAKSKLSEVATPWATPDSIASWIDGLDTGDQDVTTKQKKTTASSRQTTHKLRGLDDSEALPGKLSKDGNVGLYVESSTTMNTAQSSIPRDAQDDTEGNAALQYKGLTKASANVWFAEFCRSGSATDRR